MICHGVNNATAVLLTRALPETTPAVHWILLPTSAILALVGLWGIHRMSRPGPAADEHGATIPAALPIPERADRRHFDGNAATSRGLPADTLTTAEDATHS